MVVKKMIKKCHLNFIYIELSHSGVFGLDLVNCVLFNVQSFEHRRCNCGRVHLRLPFRRASSWIAVPGDDCLWTKLGRWARILAVDWQNLR